MTSGNKLTSQSIDAASLIKRMLVGAGIALIVILYFVLGAGAGAPDWPAYWRVWPLLITPLAGALGGAFYYFMDPLRKSGGWRKIVANIISIVVYVIGLWFGIILGLHGTMWN